MNGQLSFYLFTVEIINETTIVTLNTKLSLFFLNEMTVEYYISFYLKCVRYIQN